MNATITLHCLYLSDLLLAHWFSSALPLPASIESTFSRMAAWGLLLSRTVITPLKVTVELQALWERFGLEYRVLQFAVSSWLNRVGLTVYDCNCENETLCLAAQNHGDWCTVDWRCKQVTVPSWRAVRRAENWTFIFEKLLLNHTSAPHNVRVANGRNHFGNEMHMNQPRNLQEKPAVNRVNSGSWESGSKLLGRGRACNNESRLWVFDSDFAQKLESSNPSNAPQPYFAKNMSWVMMQQRYAVDPVSQAKSFIVIVQLPNVVI